MGLQSSCTSANFQANGQTWLGAAASFLGMWIVMMAAMMLPSLVPMLWRCLAERFESSARTPFFFPGRLDISATRLQVGNRFPRDDIRIGGSG